MNGELYIKVLGAVDIYLYSIPTKGFKGQLAKDEYKACNLFKFYLQIAISALEEADFADALINYFLASIVTADLLQKIHKLNATHVELAELVKEARVLNSAPAKLKSSIRSVYLRQSGRNSPPTATPEITASQSRSASPVLSSKQAINALPYAALFLQALPEQLTINVTSLTKVKEVRESAHKVIIYEDEKQQQLYFGKTISSAHQLDEYATEVIYASIWRYFLGQRISASLIMVDDSDVVLGICSEGLRGFVEHSKLPPIDEDSYDVFGLISIIMFAYIFMEDDLHVKNLGLATVEGESVYAKIDHDFICRRWQENEPVQALEQKFPIIKMQQVFRSRHVAEMKDIISTFRFAPGRANSPLLRLAHKLRPRKGTTIGPKAAANFGLYELPNAQEEFIAAIDLIKDTNLDEFEYRIKKIISSLACKNFPIARALSLFSSINSRLRSLQ